MLEIPRNATSCIEINLVENSSPHFNDPGYKLLFVVKRRQNDSDAEALILKQTGDVDVTISSNWRAKVRLNPADTEVYVRGASVSYWYEHRLTNGIESHPLGTDRFVIQQTLARTP